MSTSKVEDERRRVTVKREGAETCKYCSEQCDPYQRPGIRCAGACSRKIHGPCLKRGGVPSPLSGDVFFDLTCQECAPSGETLTRDKLSWFAILALTLYNLREKSSGISKRGYFHWKSDISTFVDRNWDYLFRKGTKRKKNWIGTISGTLSHFSGVFFKSGTVELGESGWWRLIDNSPPEILINKNLKIVLERKKQSAVLQPKVGAKRYESPTPSESSASVGEDSNCATDGTKTSAAAAAAPQPPPPPPPPPPPSPPSMYSRAYVQPTEILSDFLMADDDIPADMLDMLDDDMDERLELNNRDESFSISEIMRDVQSNRSHSSSGDAQHFSHTLNNLVPEWMNSGVFSPSTHFFDEKPEEATERDEEEQYGVDDSSDSSSGSIKDTPPSLFTIKTRRSWPWKKSPTIAGKRPRMSQHEESYLLQSVNKCHLDSFSPAIRRLYRKLAVRKLKREFSLPVFDIDRLGVNFEANRTRREYGNRVLDRFYSENLSGLFEQRLEGYHEPAAVHSPYTSRLLKPFIRRDSSCAPLWLRVTDELLAKANKKDPASTPSNHARGTIDYCYIRPHHIPAINSLCTQFFWPGIDLTECLQYPDFSCVVLYKKLVVGFAILVPDVGCNEAYISFFLTRPEWRRSGIGTFMLYHLMQTCMGKDVTLHVSATNPALILYQKFGFKIEEFVQDFYDKYMPPGSRECRHALFLRLSR